MSVIAAKLRKSTRWKRKPASLQVRVAALMVVVVLAFLGLVARLWYLQVYHGEELSQASEESRTRRIPTRAPRGDIRDRRGHPLADSRQSLSLEIEPRFSKTNPQLLERLAPILKTTPQELKALLDEEKNSPYAVRVADNLSQGQVAQIEEQRLYLTGALIQPNPIRHYPLGTLATHLLGYLGMIDAEELEELEKYGYRAGDYVGKGGIERRYNSLLRGVDGGREVEVDPAGRVKRVRKDHDSLPGNMLLLAIDRRVQWAAVQALAATGKPGAAVAIDPRNGEVLALASSPTYDIRPFSTRRPQKLWDPLAKDKERRPLYDRTINAQYPPASTFKPILASYALQTGAIPKNMSVFCAHGMRIGRQWKGCHKFHGWVNFENSIAESCDVFYYTIAEKLGKGGIDRIADAALMFGLGQKTGIDLAEGADGEVPTAEWRRKYHRDRWYLGDTSNVSIGQGALHATPIQIANAVAAIANGGTLYRPHVLMKAKSWDGKVTFRAEPEVIRRVPIRPEILARVRYAMRLTVTKGTGGAVKMKELEVAAKTGTAQTRKGRTNHGWFTCFAPYQNPRIAIAVIVEEGVHGGEAGGPVAKAMLEAYFGIKPTPIPPLAPDAKPNPLQVTAANAVKKPPAKLAPPAPPRPVSKFALLRGTEAPPAKPIQTTKPVSPAKTAPPLPKGVAALIPGAAPLTGSPANGGIPSPSGGLANGLAGPNVKLAAASGVRQRRKTRRDRRGRSAGRSDQRGRAG